MRKAYNWDSCKALTMDCYGTLIDWEAGILQALAPWRKRYGLEEGDEAILSEFGEAEARHEIAAPGSPYPQILQGVLRDLAELWGVQCSAEEANTFAQSLHHWPVFKDTPKALRYLKKHFKLVIISNVDKESFTYTKKLLGTDMDRIITAEEVGSYKPDLRNFEAALTFLAEQGIQKNQILHVAQSLYHDIEPAKKLGLDTAWINRRKGRRGRGATAQPGHAVIPDLEVPDLGALVALHRDATD